MSESKHTPDADSWEANAEYLLARCQHTVRQRPGGGPEDIKSSLVVTFMGMQRELDRLAAEVERLRAENAELRECEALCLESTRDAQDHAMQTMAAKSWTRETLAAERRKVEVLREALRNLLMFECDDQMPRHEADCHEFGGSTIKRDLLVAAMNALTATEQKGGA